MTVTGRSLLSLMLVLMTVADLISIPFVAPGSIGVLVARALLSEGVNIMFSGASSLRRGTPVFVTADSGADEVLARLKEASVNVIPVLDGSRLLGFLDISDGRSEGDRASEVE